MSAWLGTNTSTSELDQTAGVSTYQQNTDMKKDSELRRRRGFLSSSIAKQSGPIKYIIGAFGLGSNFLTLGVGNDSVAGFVETSQTSGPIDRLIPPQIPPKKIKPNGDRECPVFPNWQTGTISGPFAENGGEIVKSGGVVTFNFADTTGCGGDVFGDIAGSACTIVNSGPAGKTIRVSGMVAADTTIDVQVNDVTVLFIDGASSGSCSMGLETGNYFITANSSVKVNVFVMSLESADRSSAYWQVSIS